MSEHPFCAEHGRLAENALLAKHAHESVKDLCGRIDTLIEHGLPITNQRLEWLERVSEEQVNTLRDIGQEARENTRSLKDVQKAVEPLPALIEEAKLQSSIRRFWGPVLVALVALAGQVVIATWPKLEAAVTGIAGQ